MNRFILTVLTFFFAFSAKAFRIDTVFIHSNAMDSDVKTIVILPDSTTGENAVRRPAIYLLHGYGGNEKQWLSVKPNLPKIADEKGLIFVLPDGRNSWYINSPLNKSSQYETFISSELIAFIDSSYNTLAERRFRAVSGLSMGGHGALFNAFRHKDVFGAAGSTSGAVDIRERDGNLGLVKLLGDIETQKENWEQNSVLNQISNISNGDLAIYIDCGTGDFTFPLNESLHKALTENGIDHEYTTRAGVHNYDYWRNSIDYHILFFCKFFNL
jgi:S-formylglutathione hydrolase FrmB